MKRFVQSALGGAVRQAPATANRVAEFIYYQLNRNLNEEQKRSFNAKLEQQKTKLAKYKLKIEKARSDTEREYCDNFLQIIEENFGSPSKELLIEVSRRGLLHERVLHEYIHRRYNERRMDEVIDLVGEPLLGHDRVRTYHNCRLLATHEGNYSGQFNILRSLIEENPPKYLREGILDLLMNVCIYDKRLDYIKETFDNLDDDEISKLRRDTVLGISRLFIIHDEIYHARSILERHLSEKTDEEKLYFVDVLQAASSDIAESLSDWRVVLEKFRQSYSGPGETSRKAFEDEVYIPLASIPKDASDLIDVRLSRQKRLKLIQTIEGRLRNQKPLSLIRIGDGSGYAFRPKNGASDDDLMDHDKLRERLWWGEGIPLLKKQDIIARVRTAVCEADILGIPSVYRFIRDRGPVGTRFGDRPGQRALIGVIGALGEAIPLEGKIFTEERCNYIVFDKSTVEALGRDARRFFSSPVGPNMNCLSILNALWNA